MTESLLDKYASRLIDQRGGTDSAADSDATKDCGCFGFLRGRERAVMLELRKKTGNVRAVPYHALEEALFDPSEGISLHVHGTVIRLRGRHLNAEAQGSVGLFSAICRHKISWVQETERADMLIAGEDRPVVETIEW